MTANKLFSFFLLLLILASCSTEDNPENNGLNKSANLKNLGTSATDLLSSERFTSMRVEMVYVTGYEPSQKTIDNLKGFLRERTNKPDGISVVTRAVSSSDKAPFKIEEIVEIEAAERLQYNAGDEIAVYVYFADGTNEGDTDTKIILGSAYRNTSIVIYGKTIESVASRYNAPDKSTIESTVLNHEFGHLFGLVNLGSPLQSEHEDGENKGHCEVSGCLMNANVQFGSDLINMVNTNAVPGLDDQCILDLQVSGGK